MRIILSQLIMLEPGKTVDVLHNRRIDDEPH